MVRSDGEEIAKIVGPAEGRKEAVNRSEGRVVVPNGPCSVVRVPPIRTPYSDDRDREAEYLREDAEIASREVRNSTPIRTALSMTSGGECNKGKI